jgi:hypothetical protein
VSEGPEWFAPKRFGYGARWPISWQGWAITLAYVAVIIGAARLLAHAPIALAGIVVPATAAFILVVAKTTRGGWHCRWGERRLTR